MLCRLGLAFVMVLAASAPSLAQAGIPMFSGYQGTPDDQKACRPAVFKFCQAALPDTFRILDCLQRNRPRIGKACQGVLANYGQ